ncbi:MAG: hypothetical protein Q4Q04_06470 [Methanocorpusculum sp.]|nr:hypothetical protein [Methanocorpusculum sp.]
MVSEVLWGAGFAVAAVGIIFFFVRAVVRASKGECGCSSGGCAGCKGGCAACRKKM